MPSRLKRCPLERSSTLLVTLFFIGLISILVVGFLSNMEEEVGASHSHLNGVLADVYAQAGLDSGLTKLSSALSKTNTIWLSGPGHLTAFGTQVNANLNTVTNTNSVDLSSGAQPADAGANEAADLNPSLLTNAGTGLLAPTNGPMRVSWVYVLKQGEMSTNLPSYNPQNPVVGRFAYWVDDESAKINLNTAGQRGTGTSNVWAFPTNVDLTALPGMEPAQISALTASRATNFFNTTAEAARIPGIEAIIATNRFSLTPYNHAPERNMFGEPRIVLTTHKELAGGAPFLNILTNNSTLSTDPGGIDVIDTNNYIKTITMLTNSMTRTSWPFTTKALLGYNGITDPIQVAINIIDYVRSVESTNDVVEPSVPTDFEAPKNVPLQWEKGTQYFFSNRYGVSRRPYIVEVGLAYSSTIESDGTSATVPPYVTSNRYYHPITMKVSLYLPPMPNATGWQGIDLTHYALIPAITFTPDVTPPVAPALPTATQAGEGWWELTTGTDSSSGDQGNIQVSEVSPRYLLPGQCATVTRRIGIYDRNVNNITLGNKTYYGHTPSNTKWSAAKETALALTLENVEFYMTPNPDMSPYHGRNYELTRLDFCPDIDNITFAGAQKPDTVAGEGVSPTHSWRVSDPLVNRALNDWVFGNASFATKFPATYTVYSGATQQAQDRSSSGAITIGYSLPPPAPSNGKVYPGNPLGIVRSVGELGFVHTGTERTYTASLPGVTWRTFHLQPQAASDAGKFVPDWAYLDLFTVPLTYNGTTNYSPMVMVTNETNGINSGSITTNVVSVLGGRVNVNGDLALTNSQGELLDRPLPLAAMLQGTTNTATAQISSSSLIYGNTNNATAALVLASNIANHVLAANGTAYTNSSNSLYFSPGQLAEIKGIADGGEASEELLREVMPLATTRGDVFTIYSVGQSILQDQSGTIHVQGERRVAQTVERYLSGSSNQFRPISTRTLSP